MICVMHTLETPEDFVAARKALGLNQPAFADALGVDQGTISKWETGKVNPSGPAKRLIVRMLEDAAANPEAAE